MNPSPHIASNYCQYPPYVHNTLKVTPYWKNYKIGDRAYRMATDEWHVCIKPCVRLEATFEESIEPDYGQSPLELGYSPENYWSLENWELSRGEPRERVANG